MTIAHGPPSIPQPESEHPGNDWQIDTTRLIRSAASSRQAFDKLYAHLYDDLREIAKQRLQRHQAGETSTPPPSCTRRIFDSLTGKFDLRDRAHFSPRVPRHALRPVGVARARTAAKRGGAATPLPIDDIQIAADDRAAELIALDEALERLSSHDPRLASLVEYRFFGGLTYDEIAAATGLSVPTVKRDWTRARTWLYHEMQR